MSQINFLNIDLDIESEEDLSVLTKEIGTKVTVLRDEKEKGVHYASFETVDTEENQIIEEFKSIIDGLSPEAKKLWESCRKKCFDFGYESGKNPWDFHRTISKRSITSIYELECEMIVTIYPINEENA